MGRPRDTEPLLVELEHLAVELRALAFPSKTELREEAENVASLVNPEAAGTDSREKGSVLTYDWQMAQKVVDAALARLNEYFREEDPPIDLSWEVLQNIWRPRIAQDILTFNPNDTFENEFARLPVGGAEFYSYADEDVAGMKRRQHLIDNPDEYEMERVFRDFLISEHAMLVAFPSYPTTGSRLRALYNGMLDAGLITHAEHRALTYKDTTPDTDAEVRAAAWLESNLPKLPSLMGRAATARDGDLSSVLGTYLKDKYESIQAGTGPITRFDLKGELELQAEERKAEEAATYLESAEAGVNGTLLRMGFDVNALDTTDDAQKAQKEAVSQIVSEVAKSMAEDRGDNPGASEELLASNAQGHAMSFIGKDGSGLFGIADTILADQETQKANDRIEELQKPKNANTAVEDALAPYGMSGGDLAKDDLKWLRLQARRGDARLEYILDSTAQDFFNRGAAEKAADPSNAITSVDQYVKNKGYRTGDFPENFLRMMENAAIAGVSDFDEVFGPMLGPQAQRKADLERAEAFLKDGDASIKKTLQGLGIGGPFADEAFQQHIEDRVIPRLRPFLEGAAQAPGPFDPEGVTGAVLGLQGYRGEERAQGLAPTPEEQAFRDYRASQPQPLDVFGDEPLFLDQEQFRQQFDPSMPPTPPGPVLDYINRPMLKPWELAINRQLDFQGRPPRYGPGAQLDYDFSAAPGGTVPPSIPESGQGELETPPPINGGPSIPPQPMGPGQLAEQADQQLAAMDASRALQPPPGDEEPPPFGVGGLSPSLPSGTRMAGEFPAPPSPYARKALPPATGLERPGDLPFPDFPGGPGTQFIPPISFTYDLTGALRPKQFRVDVPDDPALAEIVAATAGGDFDYQRYLISQIGSEGFQTDFEDFVTEQGKSRVSGAESRLLDFWKGGGIGTVHPENRRALLTQFERHDEPIRFSSFFEEQLPGFRREFEASPGFGERKAAGIEAERQAGIDAEEERVKQAETAADEAEVARRRTLRRGRVKVFG